MQSEAIAPRHVLQCTTLLAIGLAALTLSIGCSSHKAGSVAASPSSHTPLPHDADARDMLLQPGDLKGDQWANGPVRPPFSRPCVSTTSGKLGEASVELENLTDPLHARGIDERIVIFDTHLEAMSSLDKVAANDRCYVDTLNSGGFNTSEGQLINASLTLQPAPAMGDQSFAAEITYESRANGAEFPSHGFLQSIVFVDGGIVVSLESHSFELPITADELKRVADAAFQRERSARGAPWPPSTASP